MSDASTPPSRALTPNDLPEVVRIDAYHTGAPNPDYWQRVFGDYCGEGGERTTFGFGLDGDGGGLEGFLFAEVRAFEFGSSPCGWVFAVGVDPGSLRGGVARALLEAACARFREVGVRRARTMVRRTDVPVLSFFRAQRFVGGPYVQLELDLEAEAS